MRKPFFLTFLCVLLTASSAWGAVYYVDCNADGDAGAGTSTAANVAWKTVAKVNSSSFSAGDKVLFNKGCTWREQLTVPSSGSAGSPITFGAYGTGDAPVLKGSSLVTSWTNNTGNHWKADLTSEPSMVFFDSTLGTKVGNEASCNADKKWFWSNNVLYTYGTEDPNTTYPSQIEAAIKPTTSAGIITATDKGYFTIDGIEMAQSNGFGFIHMAWATDPAGITVKNSTVSYAEDGGIVFDGINNGGHSAAAVTIDHNIVHHTNMRPSEAGAHEAITVEGVNGFTISNNLSYNNAEEGIDAKYGATNGTIYGNHVYENGLLYSGRPGIYCDGCKNTIIYNNNVHGNHGPGSLSNGIDLANENDSYPTDNVKISYNLIWNNDVGVQILSLGTSDLSNIRIYNNVISGNTPTGGIMLYSRLLNNLSGTNHIKNNIFNNDGYQIRDYTAGAYATSKFTIDYNYFNTGATTSTVGTNAVQAASPLFVSTVTPDFRLQSGSPAINAGADVGLTTDYRGIYLLGRPDIGAYEYAGSGTPVNTPLPPQPIKTPSPPQIIKIN